LFEVGTMITRAWSGCPSSELAVARRWAHTGMPIEIEHLLYECVLAALINATPLVATRCLTRPVLPACRPEAVR
jgi:hypothetical protein